MAAENTQINKNRLAQMPLAQMPFYLLLEILSYKALLKGKKVVTVNPYNTSQDDYRGLEKGERKGCRYYASDVKILDADWNASINIAKRYSKKKEAMSIKHPISFKEPIDGSLNLKGRLYQLADSAIHLAQTSRSLV